jgi:hypothetical protein
MRRSITLEQVIGQALGTLQGALYVRMPGTVVTYYPASMTADIQPMTSDPRTDLDTGAIVYEPWPVLQGVRIAWPRFGKFVCVGPLSPKDPVTLEAFDLDPHAAWAAGASNKPANPVDPRRLSGTYWSATPTNLLGPIKDAASLASLAALLGLDGDTAQLLFAVGAMTVGKTGATVSIAGGAHPLVPAPWATALASALSTFAGTVSGITPPGTLPQVVTAFATLITAAGTLKGALSGLPADATTATTAT